MYSISLCSVWFTFFVIVTLGDSSLSNDGGTYCDGTGWVAYRDEKCYKLIKQWVTRDEAKDVCAHEGSDGPVPQLATIKSLDEQIYLTELVFNKSAVTINVWIGAKRLNGNKFVWDDGSEVGEFSNWAELSPTNNIQQSCVVMKPEFMKADSNTAGQWRDVPCEMPNYVICEKLPRWSFAKLQQTLLDTRKELDETKNQLIQSTIRLEVAETKIDETKEKLFPIGFIYTQLPYEKSPTDIWPWMTWQDVSSAYAGVFFRVNGGDAAPMGQVQNDNAPRLIQIQNWYSCPYTSDAYTVIGGWSGYVLTSAGGWNDDSICVAFKTSEGEVRPRNMAIRVWKRIG